jgi:hypothetical protein
MRLVNAGRPKAISQVTQTTKAKAEEEPCSAQQSAHPHYTNKQSQKCRREALGELDARRRAFSTASSNQELVIANNRIEVWVFEVAKEVVLIVAVTNVSARRLLVGERVGEHDTACDSRLCTTNVEAVP